MSAESLQKLQQLAEPGPWTIRAGIADREGTTYWHIDGPRKTSIACVRDEATAAFIATACNRVREVRDGGC